MATTKLNARIKHKHGTAAEWALATNFIPLAGELIIYDKDENYNWERFKIGDGTTNINALPFVNDAISEEEIDNICLTILNVEIRSIEGVRF